VPVFFVGSFPSCGSEGDIEVKKLIVVGGILAWLLVTAPSTLAAGDLLLGGKDFVSIIHIEEQGVCQSDPET
jgi:hypothetical protein